jgi:hypothetical protein
MLGSDHKGYAAKAKKDAKTEDSGANGEANLKDSATAEQVERAPEGNAEGVLKADPTGVQVPRRFTKPGVDPMSEEAGVRWELRTAGISGADGSVIFEQKDVEVPTTWSQTATNIVVNKYFRGAMNTPERETSVRQLVLRVTDTITGWGEKRRYFADKESAEAFHAELTHLMVSQKAAFNSPVWFNVGVEPHPQCSACFINSVDDDMGSILDLAKTEGMLFKYGSGAGSNLSSLRGKNEQLKGGGTASGPVSFMRGFDAFAGVIKSGGKTRRAAKMVILDVDHPDIEHFVDCKREEEEKAWALIEAGYDGGFNVPGGAYDSVFFQNANHSVRVSDDFMTAVEGRRDVRPARPQDRRGHRRGRPEHPLDQDGRGGLDLRRPRHPVRHHHQRLAHLQGDRPHLRVQPLQRVHVPRRLGLQPGQPQPDEVPSGRRQFDVEASATRSTCSSSRWRSSSTTAATRPTADRQEQPRVPSARPRLRQPRRAADGRRSALRQRRGSRLRGRHHRAARRRGLRGVRRDRQGQGALRRLRQEP